MNHNGYINSIEFWSKWSGVPIDCAITLLLGFDPEEDDYWDNEGFESNHIHLKALAIDHVKNGNLSFISGGNKVFSEWMKDPCVRLTEFGDWAHSLGFELPKYYPCKILDQKKNTVNSELVDFEPQLSADIESPKAKLILLSDATKELIKVVTDEDVRDKLSSEIQGEYLFVAEDNGFVIEEIDNGDYQVDRDEFYKWSDDNVKPFISDSTELVMWKEFTGHFNAQSRLDIYQANKKFSSKKEMKDKHNIKSPDRSDTYCFMFLATPEPPFLDEEINEQNQEVLEFLD